MTVFCINVILLSGLECRPPYCAPVTSHPALPPPLTACQQHCAPLLHLTDAQEA